MRTGDGPTEDAGGATRNEENVIRLPRDWLGPPEELVPIGPAARARAAQLEAGDAPPPAADAFWSEESAALHDAVQGPPATAPDPLGSPAGLVHPAAGHSRHRLPRLSRLRGLNRTRVRWIVLAVPTVLLLVLAAIGFGERSGTGVTSRGTRTSAALSGTATVSPAITAELSSSPAIDSALAARSRAAFARHQASRAALRRHTRAHARKGPVRAATVRHHAATTHHSAPAPVRVVTQASTPQTSTGTISTPVRTPTPAPDTASKPAVAGSSSAPSPGPSGIGSMTGGCTVKCS